jgi:hypothetical protein
MDLDRLGEIERDAVAPWAQQYVGKTKGLLVHNQSLSERRAIEQPAEASGPGTVECALAQGRCLKRRRKIRFERSKLRRFNRLLDDAPALAPQLVNRAEGLDADTHAAIL